MYSGLQRRALIALNRQKPDFKVRQIALGGQNFSDDSICPQIELFRSSRPHAFARGEKPPPEIFVRQNVEASKYGMLDSALANQVMFFAR